MCILLGAAVVHFLFVALFGRLPRFMGWILTAAYLVFLWKGLGK
jgi:Ca2+/Na+ antiporter